MNRLTAIVPTANPVGLVLLAVVGFGLWGLVTYAAVRLAILSTLGHSLPRH